MNAFLDRPLVGDWPYLWLDATYLKQREGGRIVSVAAIIAVAANTDGKREIVGLHIGPSEAETFWATFLKSLMRRGLRGVKLVISDAHEGLKAAIRRVMGASWQRCRVHWMRNAQSYVGKAQQSMVSAALRQAFIQPDRASASQTLRHTADQLRAKWPKLAAFIDESETDVLTHMDFPTQHRSKIHSTNPIERVNKMGYPGQQACGGVSSHRCLTLSAGNGAKGQEAGMFYVGLDVSVARTAVCVMDAAGQVVLERSVGSTPEAITAAIRASGESVERVGLEAGINSAWIARALAEAKLPVIVIDATHAAAALKTGFRNKTDKNDARGIADLMRVNKFRVVSVKSVAAQRDRALLTVREQLRRQSLDARNIIWSILQVEGRKPPKLASPAFQGLVTQSLDDEELAPLLQPLVAVVEYIESQVVRLDKEIAARAKASKVCKRLMTVPGVGPLVALTYAAGVDDPARFSDSRTVGAHFGLTPRRFQSGEMDWSGGISRAGDAGVRRALYQAANVLIHHSRGWCALKSWAVRLAKRRGLGKAKVALARKLAVVLHKMWTTGEDYRLKAAA